MSTETRPPRRPSAKRHSAKTQRYSPFGALVFALLLALADVPKPADSEERSDGEA